MKELYISPEMEILCFAPAENIAWSEQAPAWSFWGLERSVPGTNPSSGETTLPGDYTQPVEPEEGL